MLVGVLMPANLGADRADAVFRNTRTVSKNNQYLALKAALLTIKYLEIRSKRQYLISLNKTN